MIVVERIVGLAIVQDLGRPGRMHEALAPGGALVPELLVAANRSVRNPDGAAAIEVFGKLVLEAGQIVESEPRRVAYLALRGGIEAPVVLGGRGTQLSAGIGAPLRAGDRLASAQLPPVDQLIEPFADGDTVRVIAGPDVAAFEPGALAALVAAPYRILPSSDRVGTRLEGTPLRGTAGVSRPMVRGAIEVPPDGQPIVLGPEHPTTGGYPVIAVIAYADLGKFFALRLGARVRFEIGDNHPR